MPGAGWKPPEVSYTESSFVNGHAEEKDDGEEELDTDDEPLATVSASIPSVFGND